MSILESDNFYRLLKLLLMFSQTLKRSDSLFSFHMEEKYSDQSFAKRTMGGLQTRRIDCLERRWDRLARLARLSGTGSPG